MAVTTAAININPAGGSTVPAQRSNLASLKASLTSFTIGVAGDYSAGGVPLVPSQFGFDNAVLCGWATVRTVGGAGTIVECLLDCTAPATPKLKCNAAAAECAGAGVAGAVIDVLALGY